MKADTFNEEALIETQPVPGEKRKSRRARDEKTAETETALLHAYFPNVHDESLLEKLNDLLDSYENHSEVVEKLGLSRVGRLNEGRAVAVVGSSGLGKSRSLERAFQGLGMSELESNVRIISLKAPSPCNLKQLGIAILKALKFEIQGDIRENVIWQLVREQLKLRGIRFLHIDELQHLTQLDSPYEATKVCDTFKGLMQDNEWPVWLVLSGMPNLASVIERDVQLRRRCTFVRLERMSSNADDLKTVQRIVKNYCKKAGLSDENLPMLDLCSRLLHGSDGRFGCLIEIVQEALFKAMRARRKHSLIGDFELAYEDRTGCRPEHNVFAEEVEWQNVDVRNTLYPDEAEFAGTRKPTKRRRKTSRRA
ncbi:ATP-binding protein [Roseibium sp. SCP14]|uniref:ATP-binding protein n=1 Tax=Roseibium sp. SCP14 TaxID=3141375 RepID=UPI003335D0AB